jgi:glycosyltransferase involved in cell wall biosynthesis
MNGCEMSALSSKDVLFLGKGTGVVPWYRTGMPAFHLGCDWAGMTGVPPHVQLVTSLKRGGHTPPNFSAYKIIVLQQVAGPEWAAAIYALRKQGIKVIYEVDDYLHGVKKIQSHHAKQAYTKKRLRGFEQCMSACDAMICSTEWLAQKYRRYNPNTYVCHNGVDTRLYDFELPKRRSVNIGFAGGEGHLESVQKWLPSIHKILDEFEQARFVAIGVPVAEMMKRPDRCVQLPFVAIENFPATLTNFDIAIAPAGRGYFFAGKSDLRFLETGALAIPLVADPFVYSVLDHDTGMEAETPEEAHEALRELMLDPDLRRRIGINARQYVRKCRDISVVIEQWEKVFVTVWDQ